MTLEKAKKNLTTYVKGEWCGETEELDKSAMLGIEALKGWETIRETAWFQSAMKDFSVSYLLPGETKE